MTAVAVEGASDSPSTILLAAWLTLSLDAPVKTAPAERGLADLPAGQLVHA